jgi:hypothetical protein
VAASLLERFGVPGHQTARLWRPIVIAKPACPVERMELRQCELPGITDVVEPSRVLDCGSPALFHETSYAIDLRSDCGGVAEPRAETLKKTCCERGGI